MAIMATLIFVGLMIVVVVVVSILAALAARTATTETKGALRGLQFQLYVYNEEGCPTPSPLGIEGIENARGALRRAEAWEAAATRTLRRCAWVGLSALLFGGLTFSHHVETQGIEMAVESAQAHLDAKAIETAAAAATAVACAEEIEIEAIEAQLAADEAAAAALAARWEARVADEAAFAATLAAYEAEASLAHARAKTALFAEVAGLGAFGRQLIEETEALHTGAWEGVTN